MLRLKLNIDKLTTEMLDRVPDDYWKSETTTFLDPAAAGGQILTAIEDRLRQYGHSDENISRRVFGYFKSKFYLKIAKKRNNLVGDLNVIKFLKDPMKHFDVIIANPPYQDSSTKTLKGLWPAFWEKSLNQSDIVCMITPTTWINPAGTSIFHNGEKKRLWEVFEQYKSYADIDNVAEHFGSVGSSFGYVIVDKRSKQGLEFSGGISEIWKSKKCRPQDKSSLSEIENHIHDTNNIDSISTKICRTGKSIGCKRIAIQMLASPNQVVDRIYKIDESEDVSHKYRNDNHIFIHTDDIERVYDALIRHKNIWSVQGKLRWTAYNSMQALKMLKI
jgi:hypothetical protein